MTITVANAGSVTGTSTAVASASFAAGATFSRYDAVVVLIASNNAGANGEISVTGVTDAKGHTYSQNIGHLKSNAVSANDSGSFHIFMAEVGASGLASTDNITISFSPNTSRFAAIVYRVVPSSGNRIAIRWLDSTDLFSTGPGPFVSASVNSGECIIYGVAGERYDDPSSDFDTTNGSWSTKWALNSNSGTHTTSQTVSSQYKIVTGTGTQSWQQVWTADCDWEAGYVILQEYAIVINATVAASSVAGVGSVLTTTRTVAGVSSPAAVAGTGSTNSSSPVASSTVSSATVSGFSSIPSPVALPRTYANPGSVSGLATIPSVVQVISAVVVASAVTRSGSVNLPSPVSDAVVGAPLVPGVGVIFFGAIDIFVPTIVASASCVIGTGTVHSPERIARSVAAPITVLALGTTPTPAPRGSSTVDAAVVLGVGTVQWESFDFAFEQVGV